MNSTQKPTLTPGAAPITKKSLDAVLELYKPKRLIAPRQLVTSALHLYFFEDYSLQAAGEVCGMTKQGFSRHVRKVESLHTELQQSVRVLRSGK